jgi:hypothetical protein
MRYVAKYHTTKKAWFVFDRNTQSWGKYGYSSRHNANKRVDKINGEVLAAKAKMKTDYGMQHPMDAPKPLAYKDD